MMMIMMMIVVRSIHPMAAAYTLLLVFVVIIVFVIDTSRLLFSAINLYLFEISLLFGYLVFVMGIDIYIIR